MYITKKTPTNIINYHGDKRGLPYIQMSKIKRCQCNRFTLIKGQEIPQKKQKGQERLFSKVIWHKSKGLDETKPNKLLTLRFLHKVEMHDLIESNINSMYDKNISWNCWCWDYWWRNMKKGHLEQRPNLMVGPNSLSIRVVRCLNLCMIGLVYYDKTKR